jgi:hypothetical protein
MARRTPVYASPGVLAPDSAYVVLDSEDRILRVGPEEHGLFGPLVGHPLWETLPSAEPLLRANLDRARSTGEEVRFSAFYAGRLRHCRAVPAADGLAVHIEHGAELDIRTLGTLAESLRLIEEELAARERGRHDRPAPASLPALP